MDDDTILVIPSEVSVLFLFFFFFFLSFDLSSSVLIFLDSTRSSLSSILFTLLGSQLVASQDFIIRSS